MVGKVKIFKRSSQKIEVIGDIILLLAKYMRIIFRFFQWKALHERA